MKKLISIVALLLVSFAIKAQDFEPYTSYGVQVTGRMIDGSRGFDAVFHIDRAGKKWYGMGAGLGLSAMGGGNSNLLYYGVLPVRLQIKLGMLWIEPGLENRLFLGMSDRYGQSRIDKETINTYHLAGNVALRFKLFRGLSISAGMSFGITPARDFGDTNYKTATTFVGVRYMFNQPY